MQVEKVFGSEKIPLLAQYKVLLLPCFASCTVSFVCLFVCSFVVLLFHLLVLSFVCSFRLLVLDC